MQGSPALQQEIEARVLELEALHPRIVRSRVVVEVPHRHHEHGNHVHVRIELGLPGEDVIVAHDPTALTTGDGDDSTAYEDVQAEHRLAALAVRAAFDKARRRLERVLEETER
jgi:hypothetical protein